MGKKTIIGNFETINPRLARKYIFAGKFVKDKNVLDLGCAAGYGSYYLASETGAKKVVGVDISKKAIAQAKTAHTHPKIQYLVANAQNLPFDDNSFEVVVSLEVIEHVNNYQEYLTEIKRVLEPNGTAIISTPNKAITSPNLKYPLMASHVKEFYIDELEKLLKQYFKKVELMGENPKSDNLKKHFESKRFKLQKFASQINIVRLIARYTPQLLNNIFTGGTSVPSNLTLEDVEITTSPNNAQTIIAVCTKRKVEAGQRHAARTV